MDECASLISVKGECIGTLASPFTKGERLDDPNSVKVVVNTRGYAIYFLVEHRFHSIAKKK